MPLFWQIFYFLADLKTDEFIKILNYWYKLQYYIKNKYGIFK